MCSSSSNPSNSSERAEKVNPRFINNFKPEAIDGPNEQEFEVFRGSRFRPKIDPKFNVETQKWRHQPSNRRVHNLGSEFSDRGYFESSKLARKANNEAIFNESRSKVDTKGENEDEQALKKDFSNGLINQTTKDQHSGLFYPKRNSMKKKSTYHLNKIELNDHKSR